MQTILGIRFFPKEKCNWIVKLNYFGAKTISLIFKRLNRTNERIVAALTEKCF